ncbi:MAG: hypothetical protein ACE5GE_10630 [Phycisphaerae bacterium]
MSRIKPLLWFFLKLVLLYALLMAPWPGLRSAYAATFRFVGRLCFTHFGQDGRVTFEPHEYAFGQTDTELILHNRRQPDTRGTVTCDSRLRGYFPTAFVIALILATPLPAKRRLRALLWGLLAVNVFVALRIALLIVQTFSGDHPGALYHPSPFWAGVLKQLVTNLCDAPASHFIIPIFIWITTTLRPNDLKRWMQPPP